MPFASPIRYRFAVLSTVCLGTALYGSAQISAPAVQGIVRDGQGVPQPNVLIELVGAHGALTTFTNLHGQYTLTALAPGDYSLRASTAMVLPALRRHLHLVAGSRPTINLTLSPLGERLAWLQASPASGNSNLDDWRWTLRSSVNRPMLRLAAQGAAQAGEASRASEARVRLQAQSAHGSFGVTPDRVSVAAARRAASGLVSSVRVTGDAQGRSLGGLDVALLEPGAVPGAPTRSASIRFRQLNGILDRGEPLALISLDWSQTLNIGDQLSVQAGARTQLLRGASSSFASRAFVGVSWSPAQGTFVKYDFATEPDGTRSEAPNDQSLETTPLFATDPQQRLVFASNRHQALSVGRQAGHLHVALTVEHDNSAHTVLQGRLLPEADVSGEAQGLVVDRVSRTLRAVARPYDSVGISLLTEARLGRSVTVTAGAGRSSGLAASHAQGGGELVKPAAGPWGLVAVRVERASSGTAVSAAYRWQGDAWLTTLSPFQASATTPFLSCHVRQRLGRGEAGHVQPVLAIDAQNIFQEGQHENVSGATGIALASALREIQGGLLFTF